jgi:tRNA A-37 threonylcarbamoyl transferase component Bud32
MAELFLVRDSPERLAVVKRLHRKLAIDPEFVRMFLDEAHIAATLHHPNVVEVYEICEDAEQCYIAMEHLHGHDLRRTMARMTALGTPVALAQALSVARSVAAGLHYTHERTGPDGELLGIVHRDVSPHNVILTYNGDVKIVDFGVAKANIQMSRTRTGVLKGKVAYMAPEQAMGYPLDRRSDVFCIGILLWEMTTGRCLYRRRSELETLNAVVHAPPPRPSRLVPDYPKDLERLVLKTLDRSPENRPATAGDLIHAIDEVARRWKLTLGAAQVSALMSKAFAEELAAWQCAQASGISLGDHLVAQRASGPVAELDDEHAALPVAAFDPPRRSLLRSRWPVLGAAVAAGFAAAWIVSASHRGGSPGSSPVPPAAAVPGPARLAPSASVPAAPAPSTSAPAAPATSATSKAATSKATTSKAATSKAAAPAFTSAVPGTAIPAKPAPSSGTREAAATRTATPAAPPPPTKGTRSPPKRAPGKPTAEELDKLP